MTFSERLKDLRVRAGMTQAELSAASGVPIGTLRDYEQGKRRTEPGLRTAFLLADALGVNLDSFRECVLDAPAPSPRAKGAGQNGTGTAKGRRQPRNK